MSSSTSFGTGTFGSGPLGSSPFFNVKELIDGVLYATSHANPSQYTTERSAILQFLNNRYQKVCLGQFWRWMHASYDFRLQEKYTTGTASATQGLDVITGNGTTWSSIMTPGNIFFFNTSSSVYHVLSVEADNSATLETAFSEESQTDGAYTVAQNQYKLPKETDLLKSAVIDGVSMLRLVGPEDFRLIQSRNPTATGTPQIATLIRRDYDDDAVYVEFFPAPDKFYNVHIDYSVRILKLEDSASCYPIIPDRYRSVLYYGALAEFYRFLKDPTNAQLADNDFERMLAQMRNDKQLTDQELVIIPARRYRARRRPGALGTYPVTMSIEDFGKLD